MNPSEFHELIYGHREQDSKLIGIRILANECYELICNILIQECGLLALKNCLHLVDKERQDFIANCDLLRTLINDTDYKGLEQYIEVLNDQMERIAFDFGHLLKEIKC